MSRISIEFGEPEHGWLPVKLVADNYKLDLDASDVPVDPVGLLITALARALGGAEGEVHWHLEPAVYVFRFLSEREGLRLEIVRSDNGHSARESSPEHTTTGSVDEIVMPFWRALKMLETAELSSDAWPEFPKAAMAELTELVEARQDRQAGRHLAG